MIVGISVDDVCACVVQEHFRQYAAVAYVDFQKGDDQVLCVHLYLCAYAMVTLYRGMYGLMRRVELRKQSLMVM